MSELSDKALEEARRLDDYLGHISKNSIILRECAEALDAKQAQIDSLMLEYCPDEMTKEQIEEWEKHQRPMI